MAEKSSSSFKKHHRHTSSHWIPPHTPVKKILSRHRPPSPSAVREITPNVEPQPARYELSNFTHYCTNEVCTTKYNALTFLFKNLWEQLHRAANVFFLFLMVLNFCPLFNVFNPELSAVPIVGILAITAVKDLFEDLRRRRLDNRVNGSTCRVYDPVNKRFRKMYWRHILVGDVVHISNNEEFPADLLLLRSSCEDGNAFMETSNLDGESNLKHRLVPLLLAEYCGEEAGRSIITIGSSYSISCNAPTKDVTEIHGTLTLNGRKEAFSAQNALLRGCKLKNTTFIEGVVIYAGADSKMMLNNGRAKYKRSQVERQTNHYVIGCALLLFVIVAISTVMRVVWVSAYPTAYDESLQQSVPYPSFGFHDGYDLPSSIGVFIICYQLIIPLSLYITVEFIKLGQVYMMNEDSGMYDEERDERIISRSLCTGEELGQITHVLSDKTGTLTQNSMQLMAIATPHHLQYLNDEGGVTPSVNLPTPGGTSISPFHSLITNIIACNTVFVQSGERKDVIDVGDFTDGVFTVENSRFFDYTREEFEQRVAEWEDDYSREVLEGESADEVALVKGINAFNYRLVGRASGAVHFKTPQQENKSLTILCTIPFDAMRKRMTVCVEGEEEDEVIVYTKGADSAMFRTSQASGEDVQVAAARQEEEKKLQAHVDDFSRRGYRTLVFGERRMRRDEFDEWHEWYRMAEGSRGDEEGEKNIRHYAEQLEKGVVAVGVSAVEDKLQEGVGECIEKLRGAGMQVWLLTGDKRETAEGVAHACALFNGRSILHLSPSLLLSSPHALTSVDVVIGPDMMETLCSNPQHIQLLQQCTSVLCYRLTPSHKAEMVKAVRKCGGCVLSIGDGANDVPMIQAANVGIGISGSEGMQASMAADFVITRFHFLARLLLLHGHWNYNRLSKAILYFLYKNTQNVMMCFFIQIYSGWSGAYPVSALYSVLYPVFFTSLQPLLYGIVEQDVKASVLMSDPSLYSHGRLGKGYNVRLFLLNMLDGVWQGAVVYFVPYWSVRLTDGSFEYFGFVIATCMFLTNSVHLLLECACLNVAVFIVNLCGLTLHFGYFLLYEMLCGPTLLGDAEEMGVFYSTLTADFWGICIVCVVISLLPRFVVYVVMRSYEEIRQLENILKERFGDGHIARYSL